MGKDDEVKKNKAEAWAKRKAGHDQRPVVKQQKRKGGRGMGGQVEQG